MRSSRNSEAGKKLKNGEVPYGTAPPAFSLQISASPMHSLRQGRKIYKETLEKIEGEKQEKK
jgi:hypothetical protein